MRTALILSLKVYVEKCGKCGVKNRTTYEFERRIAASLLFRMIVVPEFFPLLRVLCDPPILLRRFLRDSQEGRIDITTSRATNTMPNRRLRGCCKVCSTIP